MTVAATLELSFRPDALDEAHVVLRRVLAQTRAFDGCLGVDVLIDATDETRWVAHESWQSAEHDAAYREFRAGEGKITDLGPLLTAVPVLTMYTVADDI